MKWIIGSIFLVLIQHYSVGQDRQQDWVDSVYQSMSIDERIGQLFMIRSFAREDQQKLRENLQIIKDYHVGGVCFFQGDPTTMAKMNNLYQQQSKLPMMVGIDGEWGLGMRYPDHALSFPRQLTLGAIQNNNLIYEMGKHIAEHCKRIGIHINFAPVVDVNNNPKNPVINNRSFGEDKYNVASKSFAYMRGLQDHGVMACAKHFPGHGDTDVDSHYDLPLIKHSKKRLDSIELMPFRSIISQGVGAIMVAHLSIPSIDDRLNRPTTLSYNAVTSLLKDDLAFNGLIFTDGMEMKGVTKHFLPGKADLEAILAGNDIILLPENIKEGFLAIRKAYDNGTLSEQRLKYSVKKILKAKYAMGLTKWTPIELENISGDLNNNSSLALKAELYENAITIAKDDDQILPIKDIGTKKILTISIGNVQKSAFQKRVDQYVKAEHLSFGNVISPQSAQLASRKAQDADLVVFSFVDMSKYASKNFGIDPSALDLLSSIPDRKQKICLVFGSPYALKYFEKESSIMMGFEDDELAQDLAAQALFGVFDIRGKLPVTASKAFKAGQGIYKSSLGRLGYSIPERVGMSSSVLAGIDTIVDELLGERAAPGCQILVARKGKIVFDKSYGHFTYARKRAVQKDDIFDVASITKTCATTISLMKLYDENRLDLRAPVDRYIPEADTCNKGNLIVQALLAHHARLIGWIPYYKSTLTDSRIPKPSETYYSKRLQDGFTIPVAEQLFLRTDYRDTIWSKLYASELRDEPGYRYSDLAFYLMDKCVNNITGDPLDEYASRIFYEPLGLFYTGYKPLGWYPKEKIVPTEQDQYFRYQKLQGYVHDMGAAMMGGVSGHAGLFSNAHDLAVIHQMILNGGQYGGHFFFSPQTIQKFTKRFSQSTRRGLGFDMKELDESKTINMSELASEETFGHLGFTGCAAFADPKYDLIYIFLSNRTYPSMRNNKLGRNDYRPRIQSKIYESILQQFNT